MTLEPHQPLDARDVDLVSSGWIEVNDISFPATGPLWYRKVDDEHCHGFIAQPQHLNRFGTIHGGMIATLADCALGRAARHNSIDRNHSTIDLSIHFLDAGRLDDFVVARARLMRETRSVVFVDGVIEANGRLLANVSGIWKIHRPKQSAGESEEIVPLDVV